jgi:hypothetical protein
MRSMSSGLLLKLFLCALIGYMSVMLFSVAKMAHVVYIYKLVHISSWVLVFLCYRYIVSRIQDSYIYIYIYIYI